MKILKISILPMNKRIQSTLVGLQDGILTSDMRRDCAVAKAGDIFTTLNMQWIWLEMGLFPTAIQSKISERNT